MSPLERTHKHGSAANARNRRDARTHLRMLAGISVVAALLALPLLLSAGVEPAGKPASYPAWWFEQDVLAPNPGTTNSPPQWPGDFPQIHDRAALNQGQLKWIAKGAYGHLEGVFTDPALDPAVSGAITNSTEWSSLTNMIHGWGATSSGDMDYAVANQGQVKEVARHFYAVFDLPEVAYYSDSISGWNFAEQYPWTTETPQALDYVVVNQGQVKNLFAFDLSSWQPTTGGVDPLDTDGDGLLDSWEQAIVDADANDAIVDISQILPSDDSGSPQLYWDFDGDGYDNLTEHLNETDPADFYNGETPVLVLVPGYGEGQLVSDGYFLPALQVKVTDSNGSSFQNGNVPVTFTVSGPGGLTPPSDGGGAPDGSEDAQSSLTLITTRNGSNEDIATVYFSSETAGESTITVSLDAPGAADLVIPIRAWLGNNLVACWEFDEDSDTVAVDGSGFGQDATIQGDPTHTASWNDSLALQFDGTDDYLSLSGTSDDGLDFVTQSFTVSFWVNTTATDARLIGTGMDNWEVGYYIGLDASGQIVAGAGGDSDSGSMLIRTTAAINDGTWHHVTVVFAGGGTSDLARIYVDGQPQALAKADTNTGGTLTDVGAELNSALDVSALTAMDASSSEPFTIGAYTDGTTPSAYFTGLLDDVRIYHTALSAAEVLSLTDTDADNLPDLYEFGYFPEDPDALTYLNGDDVADFDGDSISDWDEYDYAPQAPDFLESDPTDYYSQSGTLIQPAIALVSGDAQSVDAGAFTTNPLVAKVVDDADGVTLLQNAPVEFSVYLSTGKVSASAGSDPVARGIVRRTASNGEASAYFQAPTALSTNAQVRAMTGKVSPVNVSYTVTVNGPPEPPRNITLEEHTPSDPNDDTEPVLTVSWADFSNNETGFKLEYQQEDGTWVELADLGPDTTEYIIRENDPVYTPTVSLPPNLRVGSQNTKGTSLSEESDPEKPAPRYAIIDLGTGTPKFVNNSGAVAIQDGDKAFYWENGERTEIKRDGISILQIEGMNDDGVVICSWEEIVTIGGYSEAKYFAGYSIKGDSVVKLDFDYSIAGDTLDNFDYITSIFFEGDIVYADYNGGTDLMVEWNPYNGTMKGLYERGPAVSNANEEPYCANDNGEGIFEVFENYDDFVYVLTDLWGNEIHNFGDFPPTKINNNLIAIRGGQWWDGEWHSLGSGSASYINNRMRSDEAETEIPDFQILGTLGSGEDQELVLWEKRDTKGEYTEHYYQYKVQDLVHDPERWQVLPGTDFNDLGMIVTMVQEYNLDEDGKRTTPKGDAQGKALLPMEIVPDWNRDGKIDKDDRGKITQEKPFRWWYNSDNDQNDANGDDFNLGGPGDAYIVASVGHGGVDSTRDLIDFFPLYLDIKEILEVFPPSENIKYILKQEDDALNAVFTDLVAGKVSDFLLKFNTQSGGKLDNAKSIGGSHFLFGTKTFPITSEGHEIEDSWLKKITDSEDEYGVLLLEGKGPFGYSLPSSKKPLVLEVQNNGSTVFEHKFNIKISKVDDFFRHKNLVAEAGESVQTDYVDRLGQPDNFPDEETNGKSFIFVHGCCTDQRQASGWHAEIFKRMYQSGSKAKFYGITWNGDNSTSSQGTPDYWENVINAFKTSSELATYINGIDGKKFIAAHSLGNIVVSSAIKDHSMSVDAYFMCNAAIALEAMDASGVGENLLMRHPSWSSYDNKRRLWASRWHKLFEGDSNDGRNGLTWKDRFGNIPNAYNYRSSGEDTLNNGNGSVPSTWDVYWTSNRAWVSQEMSKGGSGLVALLTQDSHGGWGFSSHYDVVIGYTQGNHTIPIYGTRPPDQTDSITDDELKAQPFFKDFQSGTGIVGQNGSTNAKNYETRAKVLAEAIPSMSFAVGRNDVPIFEETERNINLMGLKTDITMWVDSSYRADTNWKHSDIKAISYLYVSKVFIDFVRKGNLSEE